MGIILCIEACFSSLYIAKDLSSATCVAIHPIESAMKRTHVIHVQCAIFGLLHAFHSIQTSIIKPCCYVCLSFRTDGRLRFLLYSRGLGLVCHCLQTLDLGFRPLLVM